MLKWVHHSPPPKNHAHVKSSEALFNKDKENERQCENNRQEKENEKAKEEKEILEALRRHIGVRKKLSSEKVNSSFHFFPTEAIFSN